METTRRDFLKYASCAASAIVLSNVVTGKAAAQSSTQSAMPLEKCISMTPLEVAESSSLVQVAWGYLHKEISRIEQPALRSLVAGAYEDPSPRLATRLDASTRKEVWKELQAQKYTEQAEADFLPPLQPGKMQPHKTIAAPGSGYTSHHAYPGGLITHLATNVMITDGIVNTYREVYGYEVDRDIAMAAQLLHDLHKPYVFQWQPDASSRKEEQLAGTGQHHTLSAAELIVRGAPAELVVAQACAHTHPGFPEEEKQVVGWLKAAAIIAGVDPVKYGLLDASGQTLPLPRRQEGFLCHLGDHDFVLSVPAVKWTLPIMKQIAMRDYRLSEADCAGKPFNSLRNMVYSRVSAMRLENVYATSGEEGVRQLMLSVVSPAKA